MICAVAFLLTALRTVDVRREDPPPADEKVLGARQKRFFANLDRAPNVLPARAGRDVEREPPTPLSVVKTDSERSWEEAVGVVEDCVG